MSSEKQTDDNASEKAKDDCDDNVQEKPKDVSQLENGEEETLKSLDIKINSNERLDTETKIRIDYQHGDVKNVGCGHRNHLYGYYTRDPVWVNFFWDGAPVGPQPYDPRTRNSFVKLVMTITLVMLIATGIFIALVLYTGLLRDIFLKYGMFMAIAGMVIMLALSYVIACSACSRVFPCNIICLVFAVIGMCLTAGFITVRYETQIVLYAFLATIAVVFVCVCLACTNYDFTQWTLFVIVISVAFSVIAMIVGLVMLLTGTYMPVLHLVILIVGTLLNVIMLTIELQMILGGKTIELDEEDYALGAFFLYTSIIQIFLNFVQMFGIFDNM